MAKKIIYDTIREEGKYVAVFPEQFAPFYNKGGFHGRLPASKYLLDKMETIRQRLLDAVFEKLMEWKRFGNSPVLGTLVDLDGYYPDISMSIEEALTHVEIIDRTRR